MQEEVYRWIRADKVWDWWIYETADGNEANNKDFEFWDSALILVHGNYPLFAHAKDYEALYLDKCIFYPAGHENSGAVWRIRHDYLCLILCDIVSQSYWTLKTMKYRYRCWSKGTSEKYSITGKVTGILCEDTVFNNDTSEDKLLRSERMVRFQWGCYLATACRTFII